jgi:hypothetical protein
VKNDQVGKFWVVTLPNSPDSERVDICFETDVEGFALQTRGGLDADRVVGLFKTQADAAHVADALVAGLRAAKSRAAVALKEPEPDALDSGHREGDCPACREEKK